MTTDADGCRFQFETESEDYKVQLIALEQKNNLLQLESDKKIEELQSFRLESDKSLGKIDLLEKQLEESKSSDSARMELEKQFVHFVDSEGSVEKSASELELLHQVLKQLQMDQNIQNNLQEAIVTLSEDLDFKTRSIDALKTEMERIGTCGEKLTHCQVAHNLDLEKMEVFMEKLELKIRGLLEHCNKSLEISPTLPVKGVDRAAVVLDDMILQIQSSLLTALNAQETLKFTQDELDVLKQKYSKTESELQIVKSEVEVLSKEIQSMSEVSKESDSEIGLCDDARVEGLSTADSTLTPPAVSVAVTPSPDTPRKKKTFLSKIFGGKSSSKDQSDAAESSASPSSTHQKPSVEAEKNSELEQQIALMLQKLSSRDIELIDYAREVERLKHEVSKIREALLQSEEERFSEHLKLDSLSKEMKAFSEQKLPTEPDVAPLVVSNSSLAATTEGPPSPIEYNDNFEEQKSLEKKISKRDTEISTIKGKT